FSCGGYQCWCGKVGITESQMDWIAGQYKDCLCPGCLEKVSTGELGPHPMSHHEPAT
ncbi:MAG: cysteine-rich CWC family protein, partial [Nitrospira sp.]|nr:cysteine-rich CWC family protein [Nitrospira sp.]